MPWSQRISMNCRPPRPMLANSEATVAPRNDRIRNSSMWNIGSGTLGLHHHEQGQQGHAPDQLGIHRRVTAIPSSGPRRASGRR